MTRTANKDWLAVDKSTFDALLDSKKFTTETVLPMGAVKDDNKLDDLFFIDRELVGKMKCDNGSIKYFILEGEK